MSEKRYYSIRELAKEKDCPLSQYMIRKLIDEGKLPHVSVGRKYLIDKQAVAEWLNAQKP